MSYGVFRRRWSRPRVSAHYLATLTKRKSLPPVARQKPPSLLWAPREERRRVIPVWVGTVAARQSLPAVQRQKPWRDLVFRFDYTALARSNVRWIPTRSTRESLPPVSCVKPITRPRVPVEQYLRKRQLWIPTYTITVPSLVYHRLPDWHIRRQTTGREQAEWLLYFRLRHRVVRVRQGSPIGVTVPAVAAVCPAITGCPEDDFAYSTGSGASANCTTNSVTGCPEDEFTYTTST